MRNRDYKNYAPGGYYHIYNRGNAKRDIFLDPDDYRFFLLRLRQNLKPNGNEPRNFRPLPQNSFTLLAYCLMPNHFHFLIRQNSNISTGTLMGKICTSYSMYFNKKYNQVGHIFQDRFKQIDVLDDQYFLWLTTYIHLNPSKANIISDPFQYSWSSIKEYTGEWGEGLCETHLVTDRFGGGSNAYREYLQEAFQKDDHLAPNELRLDEM